MKVRRIRFLVQIISFLLLIYGGYVGLRFKNFLPMWACTNPSNYSAACYLLPLQRLQEGLSVYPLDYHRTMPFPGYVIMWGWWAYLSFFLSLIVFAIVFNKTWCGWFCPFGTFQDWISSIRKKIGIREIQFSERTKHILAPIKYISLMLFLITPAIYALGFNTGTPIFCKICPVKSFLSIFEGNLLNFGIGYPPGVMASILTCIITGVTLVGIIFKERFFCFFCPIAGFINIFNKFSFFRFRKNVNSCNGCGNCWRVCPMDIKEVYQEKTKENVLAEDCILCLKCIEACPQDNALFVRFFKKDIFSSTRGYFTKLFIK